MHTIKQRSSQALSFWALAASTKVFSRSDPEANLQLPRDSTFKENFTATSLSFPLRRLLRLPRRGLVGLVVLGALLRAARPGIIFPGRGEDLTLPMCSLSVRLSVCPRSFRHASFSLFAASLGPRSSCFLTPDRSAWPRPDSNMSIGVETQTCPRSTSKLAVSPGALHRPFLLIQVQ